MESRFDVITVTSARYLSLHFYFLPLLGSLNHSFVLSLFPLNACVLMSEIVLFNNVGVYF